MTPRPPTPLSEIASFLDLTLRVSEIPDYPGAVNGIQVECATPIRRVAVAVDASLRTIRGAIAAEANLLVVHHGLFWSPERALRGRVYERFRELLINDVAVYSAHLPLDAHPTLGNNALLAWTLGLEPTGKFAHVQGAAIGVSGTCDMETTLLIARADQIARAGGGSLVVAGAEPAGRTKRWAVCTGAGASSDTLHEAAAASIDTLIVGEGPHHTAIDAYELGITVLYAGHYATETFGVRALGEEIERQFGIPWTFIPAPTGL